MTNFHSISVFRIACLMLLCGALLIRESNARPPWSDKKDLFHSTATCKSDDELLDLCQRCEKVSKSKGALEQCCSPDVDARRWCSDFVYFGRG